MRFYRCFLSCPAIGAKDMKLRAKAAAGQIAPESADHMIAFIQDRRDEKIRRILEYSDRDLNKLSEMVAMAQSTVLRSIESNG